MKKILLFIITALILIAVIYGVSSFSQIFKRSNEEFPKVNIIGDFESNLEEVPLVSVVADNLSIPWAIAFLPDNTILFTERGGAIKTINNGSINQVASINVSSEGEGGLHGIAVDPEFEDNNYIYIYYTAESGSSNSINRVARYRFIDERLSEETIIINNIPGALIHDGGRLKFGPDGYLYITTGDAAVPSLSQNRDSLAGKILRVDRDGNPAPNNPFGTAIYSYGHRNPQGITWDDNNQLYSTEHGSSAYDEFNMISLGRNYGWPTITGSQTQEDMMSPLAQSGSNTWAPGGLAYINEKFYFGGLRGNALFQLEQVGEDYRLTEYFKGEFGRIREVVAGPDKMLYITTSNRDGRGVPSGNDDRIIRINPFIL